MALGSIFFTSSNSYLKINESSLNAFNLGSSDDFTIEWFQYQQDINSWPRIFSVGKYSTANIAVSIESGTFYFWLNSGVKTFFSVTTPIMNEWVHFAISRNSGNLRIFQNGVLKKNISSSDTITLSNDLYIGVEALNDTVSSGSNFVGNITNFHWVSGTGKYITDFTINLTDEIQPILDTQLLLLTRSNGVYTDSSSNEINVSELNTEASEETPFTVPCLTESCTILTPTGYQVIKSLKENDYILTDENKKVKIKKIICLNKINENTPLVIPQDYFGSNIPFKNTIISANHAFKQNQTNNDWNFPKNFNFKQSWENNPKKYYNIKLENYLSDNLVVNGLTMESWDGFYPNEKRPYKWKKQLNNSFIRLKN